MHLQEQNTENTQMNLENQAPKKEETLNNKSKNKQEPFQTTFPSFSLEQQILQTPSLIFTKMLNESDFLPESQLAIHDYKCFLCKGIYFNAMVETSCGHVFCFNCISLHLTQNPFCPLASESKPLSLANLVRVEAIHEILNKQFVYCRNRNHGCAWTGMLSARDTHQEAECQKQILLCTNKHCEASFFRENAQAHFHVCDWRILACQYCEEHHACVQMISHFDFCAEIPVACGNNCELFVKRKELRMHLENECANGAVNCDYFAFGCLENLIRKNKSEHLRVCVKEHLELISRRVFDLSILSDNNQVITEKVEKSENEKFFSCSENKLAYEVEVDEFVRKTEFCLLQENVKAAFNDDRVFNANENNALKQKIEVLEAQVKNAAESRERIEEENADFKVTVHKLLLRIKRIEDDKQAEKDVMAKCAKLCSNSEVIDINQIHSLYQESPQKPNNFTSNPNTSDQHQQQNSSDKLEINFIRKNPSSSFKKNSRKSTSNNGLLANIAEDSDENLLQKKVSNFASTRDYCENPGALAFLIDETQALNCGSKKAEINNPLLMLNKNVSSNLFSKKEQEKNAANNCYFNNNKNNKNNNNNNNNNFIEIDLKGIETDEETEEEPILPKRQSRTDKKKKSFSTSSNSNTNLFQFLSNSAAKTKKPENTNNSNINKVLTTESEKKTFFHSLQYAKLQIKIKDDKIIEASNYLKTPKFAFGNEIKLAQLEKNGTFSFKLKILSAKSPFMVGLCRRDQVTFRNHNNFYSPDTDFDRGCFLFSTDYKTFNANKKSEDGVSLNYHQLNNDLTCALTEVSEDYVIWVVYCFSRKTLKFSIYANANAQNKNRPVFETELSDVYSNSAKEDSTGLSPVFVFSNGGAKIAVKSFLA